MIFGIVFVGIAGEGVACLLVSGLVLSVCLACFVGFRGCLFVYAVGWGYVYAF